MVVGADDRENVCECQSLISGSLFVNKKRAISLIPVSSVPIPAVALHEGLQL